MATKLYFHDVGNALTGTFPTAKQSALTQNYLVSGGNTLETMSTTKGTAMANAQGTSLATISSQSGFYKMFCSDTFDVNQNVGGGGQTLTVNIAMFESTANMNMGGGLTVMLYVWRPSTGAAVGTVNANTNLTGDAEPGSNSIRVDQGTTTTSTLVAALAGDVLICEVWQTHTQATAASNTGRIYFDGTVENTVNNTIVTDHASFLNFSADTLTFGAPPSGATGTFNNTLGATTLSATGKVTAAGSFSNTLGAATMSAEGDVTATGTFNNTLGAATLAATGKALAASAFNNTLGAATLSATGIAYFSGTFNNTLGAATLSATSAVTAKGTFNNTLGAMTLSATGKATVGATFNNTLGAMTLSAVCIASPLPRGVTTVQDALNRYLFSLGFMGSLNDKVKAYLISVTTGATSANAVNDLWIRHGSQQGYGFGIQYTQRSWALANGSVNAGPSWNDRFVGLPE